MEHQTWHGQNKKINCGLNIAIMSYKIYSWVSKSSAPSLETAIAYRMSLWWASFFILFSSVSCYPAFRQCCSLIISFESSIICVRLSAEGIHRLYELQHLMMPLNAAVQLQWRSLYVSSCQRNKLVFRVHVIAILWPKFNFFFDHVMSGAL